MEGRLGAGVRPRLIPDLGEVYGDRDPPIVDRPIPGVAGLENREVPGLERPDNPGVCGRGPFRRSDVDVP